MKNKELIEFLQMQNPEARAVVMAYKGNTYEIYEPDEVIPQNEGNEYVIITATKDDNTPKAIAVMRTVLWKEQE